MTKTGLLFAILFYWKAPNEGAGTREKFLNPYIKNMAQRIRSVNAGKSEAGDHPRRNPPAMPPMPVPRNWNMVNTLMTVPRALSSG